MSEPINYKAFSKKFLQALSDMRLIGKIYKNEKTEEQSTPEQDAQS